MTPAELADELMRTIDSTMSYKEVGQWVCANQEALLAALRSTDALAVEALQALAGVPVEDFDKQHKPEYPLMAWNGHTIYVKHVLAARKALGASHDE